MYGILASFVSITSFTPHSRLPSFLSPFASSHSFSNIVLSCCNPAKRRFISFPSRSHRISFLSLHRATYILPPNKTVLVPSVHTSPIRTFTYRHQQQLQPLSFIPRIPNCRPTPHPVAILHQTRKVFESFPRLLIALPVLRCSSL